jgi:translation initiation factor RLI1
MIYFCFYFIVFLFFRIVPLSLLCCVVWNGRNINHLFFTFVSFVCNIRFCVICYLLVSRAHTHSQVIVVEHDLSVLDYLSDFICCLYGTPGIYGVVTMPFSVREGINIFLAGFIPSENLRFRETALSFKVRVCYSNVYFECV